MSYGVYKSTFSEGHAYRYRITDDNGEAHYVAEPTGESLPNPTRLVTISDTNGEGVGSVVPLSTSIWQWVRRFALQLMDEDEPRATIEERWNLVDRILLRLPCYRIQIGERTYTAHGKRHGEVFYELYSPLEGDESDEEGEQNDLPELSDTQIIKRLERQEKLRLGVKIGEITRPPSGANYLIDIQAASLRQNPLALTAITILADMHLHGQ